MYCGDETGAFVGDCGSCTSRFGYGGEDTPKLVVGSHIGWSNSKNEYKVSSSGTYNKELDLLPLYQQPPRPASLNSAIDSFSQEHCQGISFNSNDLIANLYGEGKNDATITNFDIWEGLWENAFHVMNVTDPYKNRSSNSNNHNIDMNDKVCHPILASEAGHAPKGQREKVLEILFEKFDAPAAFIATAPALSAFSFGRQTALVVDIGGGGARATPVVDGMILRKAQRYSHRGGEWFSDQLHQTLTNLNFPIVPRVVQHHLDLNENGNIQTETKLNISRSHYLVSVRELLFEFKAIHTGLYPNKIKDPNVARVAVTNHLNYPGHEYLKEFHLPGGAKVELLNNRQELFLAPDIFFEDQTSSSTHPIAYPGDISSCGTDDSCFCSLPLHKMAYEALLSADSDIRKELCNNIIFCGGGSLVKGMEQRLTTEITNQCPSPYKCKVIASKNFVERSYSQWIGGSVLTSLGSFQQLWLSRSEYDEFGSMLAARRFN